jgi:hypothetical protein
VIALLGDCFHRPAQYNSSQIGSSCTTFFSELLCDEQYYEGYMCYVISAQMLPLQIMAQLICAVPDAFNWQMP